MKIHCVNSANDLIDLTYWEDNHNTVVKYTESDLDKFEVMRLMNWRSECNGLEELLDQDKNDSEESP